MATRVKDGIFVADGESSPRRRRGRQDPEFIELNKISYVVNCAGRELPNLWSQHGVRYLTFGWDDDPGFALFDSHDRGQCVVVEQIVAFVDEALVQGESVLLHSFRGTGRCICCCVAYFMAKYEWGADKSLAFVRSKRADACPNAGFLRQLRALDRRLQHVRARKVALLPPRERPALAEAARRRLVDWDATAPRLASRFEPPDADAEELVADEEELVNSFFNGQMRVDVRSLRSAAHEMPHTAVRLRWTDGKSSGDPRRVVSGPSGSGREPSAKTPRPLKGILKKPPAPPAPEPPPEEDPDERLREMVRDVEVGSPARQARGPRDSLHVTRDRGGGGVFGHRWEEDDEALPDVASGVAVDVLPVERLEAASARNLSGRNAQVAWERRNRGRPSSAPTARDRTADRRAAPRQPPPQRRQRPGTPAAQERRQRERQPGPRERRARQQRQEQDAPLFYSGAAALNLRNSRSNRDAAAAYGAPPGDLPDPFATSQPRRAYEPGRGGRNRPSSAPQQRRDAARASHTRRPPRDTTQALAAQVAGPPPAARPRGGRPAAEAAARRLGAARRPHGERQHPRAEGGPREPPRGPLRVRPLGAADAGLRAPGAKARGQEAVPAPRVPLN